MSAPWALAWVLAAAPPHTAEHRWPAWPTEVERIVERAFDLAGSDEDQRREVFRRLHAYATPLVEKAALRGARDPSSQLRREALDLCASRELESCIPAAIDSWNTNADAGERIKALRVIALDPTEARATLLFSALREPDEALRWEAVRVVARAPFGAEGRRQASARLAAKLGDGSARVRGDAAEGLSLLAEPASSLSVVRLLEDADPAVREAAVRALGRFADPRTRPALERAIARGGPPTLVREALLALAGIPGVEADRALLRLLDDPPDGEAHRATVAEAIARRRPGPELLEGLVDRLSAPTLRPHVLLALGRHGDAAVPAIEAALAHGVEPSLAAELEALLAARSLPSIAARSARPGLPLDRPEAWRARLSVASTPEADRLAGELGRRAPAWLWGAIADGVARAGTPSGARAWLVALASATRAPVGSRGDTPTWLGILAWALEPGASAPERCLAIAALGAAAGSPAARRVLPALSAAIEDPDPVVRACLAPTLGRLGAARALVQLARDPSPSVRAGAALGAAQLRRLAPELRRTLRVQALHDASAPARGAAAWALAEGTRRVGIVHREGVVVDPALAGFVPVRASTFDLWLPAAGAPWAIAPAGARAAPGAPRPTGDRIHIPGGPR